MGRGIINEGYIINGYSNDTWYTPETGIVGTLPETLEFHPWVTRERRDYITAKFNSYKIAWDLEQQ